MAPVTAGALLLQSAGPDHRPGAFRSKDSGAQVKRLLQLTILAPFLLTAGCAARSGTADGAADAAHGAHDAAADTAHGHDAAHEHNPAHHPGGEYDSAIHRAHVAAGHHGGAASASGHPPAHPADVKFMQDMIGHHAQALVMAAMAPTRGAGDHLLRLVEKIDISQRDEIDMMKRWLTERHQPVPDPADHSAHAAHMPGMLTPEQMAQLDAARGREFERLFLMFMIQHHEGALVMVDELFASPGAAQDSDIFRFATDVAADQLDEIDQMQYLLDVLSANPGSEIR